MSDFNLISPIENNDNNTFFTTSVTGLDEMITEFSFGKIVVNGKIYKNELNCSALTKIILSRLLMSMGFFAVL